MTETDLATMGRRVLRGALARMGLDVRRAHGDARRLAMMLAHHGVSVVFDIGANRGEYGTELRCVGYRGRIVSFEPLAVAHAELVQVARGDAAWQVPAPVALGDADGEVEMHVSENVTSSSVLDMLTVHESAAPDSHYVRSEKVRCVRLDSVASQYLTDADRLFLKLDVQGFEDRVLDGAPATLARAAGLQIELSVVPLYRGALTYEPMLARLAAQGFQLWHLWPGFRDELTARMLQFDAVLMR